jgi:hypothetical protein
VNSLKPLAQGVIADLRARGLLPVAILLAVALVAVPVLLSRSPEPVAVEAAAPVDPVDTGGLPGPAEALGERPLVTLASLDGSSDLESFNARDPFKPLRTLDAINSDPATSVAFAPTAGTAGEPTGGSGGGVGSVGGAVAGNPATGGDTGGGDTGGGDTGGGDTGGQTPTPEPTPPDPGPAPERSFTYAVDLTFDGPESAPRTYRNLPRLSMLPNEASPLLIFLGVGADLNDVVFLVDSKLRASSEGEGTCSPSPEECATVSIEPGEQQVFLDDKGGRYVLGIDQIREVPLAVASQEADEPTTGTAKASIGEPVRRFLPQLLTELLVIGGQQ